MPSGGTAKNNCTSGEPAAAYNLPSSVSTHFSLLISYKTYMKTALKSCIDEELKQNWKILLWMIFSETNGRGNLSIDESETVEALDDVDNLVVVDSALGSEVAWIGDFDILLQMT